MSHGVSGYIGLGVASEERWRRCYWICCPLVDLRRNDVSLVAGQSRTEKRMSTSVNSDTGSENRDGPDSMQRDACREADATCRTLQAGKHYPMPCDTGNRAVFCTTSHWHSWYRQVAWFAAPVILKLTSIVASIETDFRRSRRKRNATGPFRMQFQ